MLNSESIVIIRIKGEHLQHSKISGGDDRLWMGECLLYSKVSGWKVYYIANIPREGLLYDMCNEVCHTVRENALTVNCSLIFKP